MTAPDDAPAAEARLERLERYVSWILHLLREKPMDELPPAPDAPPERPSGPDAWDRPESEDVEAPRVQGVCFLLVRGAAMLMERCPKKAARHGGEWFIPGGRIEEGETEEQALYREVAEELGVSVHGYEALPLVDATGGESWGAFLMRPYRLLAWRGELPDHCRDHSDVPLRWVPLTEALVSPVHAVRAMVALLPETAAALRAEREQRRKAEEPEAMAWRALTAFATGEAEDRPVPITPRELKLLMDTMLNTAQQTAAARARDEGIE